MSLATSLTQSMDSAVSARMDEIQAAVRLEAARVALDDPSEGALLSFFQSLYAHAAPEDLARYSPEGLAALARIAFAQGASRKPGETALALVDGRAEDKEYDNNDTLLIAINDDMPFLYDSLINETQAMGVRLRAVFHPVVWTERNANGFREAGGEKLRESVIILALDPIVHSSDRAELLKRIGRVFAAVQAAVADWKKMREKLFGAIATLKSHPPAIADEQLAEDIAFLEWLGDNHFTFLGYREYGFDPKDGGYLSPIDESGLGVLADAEARVLRRGPDRTSLTPQVRSFLTEPSPLIITKSSERSAVHRRVHMDYIGVKLFHPDGTLKGECRFVGLFTSGAYSRKPSEIPLIRRKVSRITERAALARDSHDGKALAHILDTYPRDELFQIGEDELFTAAMAILRLGDRPRVRVFARFDRFDRYVSLLVYLPRERFDSDASIRIHALLAEAFEGRMSSAQPFIEDSALARVHYIVGRNPGIRPPVDLRTLEQAIADTIRTWDDGLADAFNAVHGEIMGARMLRARSPEFSPGYRGIFRPEEAIRDLAEIEKLSTDGQSIHARAYRNANDSHKAVRLKLYLIGDVLPLSASLPIFENLGLKVIAEDSFPLSFRSDDGWSHEAAILDFQMEFADEHAASFDDIKVPLEDAFHAVMAGKAESDGFNRLVIASGLAWRDVTILRAAAKYLRQANITFAQDYMEQALARNPDLARLLVELFYARSTGDSRLEETLSEKIAAALKDVQSLDDDRIIRRIANVIACVLRTNFHQKDENGEPKQVLSFKLDSTKLDELPLPRPHVEIFVYAPEIEGVHLRFGRIARGGLRWSDRRDDFRTEILGLVKAQQVKNAVIVPVGSKGGFYPKLMPANPTREQAQGVAIAAYKQFIGALLDITDNLDADGNVVPPPDCVRHDGDDPYLVVAADKGTATFSDIANGIAESRGFWLGDAFASGGSKGYDHKKMGITARGAWEAVKRHFRELGKDIQSETFTVVGVGDMSGDVFGNGMLLSQHTKLVAAFDHRHIFFDPTPDPAASFAERKRLFDLPRSSWADYDAALISEGGGIFARTAKEIPLNAPLKALTGLAGETATPFEVIRALLKADIDLLWFGGIGTYVKAASQNNLDAGDRANDSLRVNGKELRAKVVGEGANLGMTQAGRIEYARTGGRLNTDAIDNSAGVDTSDHEVNLKILLSTPLRRGALLPDARDALLGEWTNDVAKHVLADNYDQTLALSVAEVGGYYNLDAAGRFMQELEKRGKLDRSVEFLPDDEELRRRTQAKEGLTRPELAVLLAYAKLDLDAALNATDVPDDAAFATALTGYFPEEATKRFPDEVTNHRLRREIVSTVLCNRIVNLAGPFFVHRMQEMSGTGVAPVVRAFAVADGAFGLSALKTRIDTLDLKVDAKSQIAMYAEIAELLRKIALWFVIRLPAKPDLAAEIALSRAGVEALRGSFESFANAHDVADYEKRVAAFQKAGAPLDVARDVALLPMLMVAPEIARIASDKGLPAEAVAAAYFAIGNELGLDRLRDLASKLHLADHWDRLALSRIVDDLYTAQSSITAAALGGSQAAGKDAAAQWIEKKRGDIELTKAFLTALERSGEPSVAKLTLAVSRIRETVGN